MALDSISAFWHQLTARPDFWGFVSIPLVAATVTWVHVWFAMKMVFYPLEFVGVLKPWLGWQGIVPRKAEKIARIVVDNTLSKVASLRDIFHDLEPQVVAIHVGTALAARVEQLVDEIIGDRSEQDRARWAALPPALKEVFYGHVRQQLPQVMVALMRELEENVEEYIDLRAMLVRRLGDPALMVRTFCEVGAKEISFIVNASFWIGLLCGVIQMATWYVWPFRWGLPLYGMALGYLTNWVALNMVFRPLEPVRVGRWRLQGVFLKRQPQVAQTFAELSARELLTVEHIMTEIITGERADRTRTLMSRHLAPLLEGGMVGAAVQLTFGPQGHAELQRAIVEKATLRSLEPLRDPAFNQERARVVARVFQTRLAAMTPAEFQGVLRPAFQEDEWILIALGAIFGFLAGWAQLALGFN